MALIILDTQHGNLFGYGVSRGIDPTGYRYTVCPFMDRDTERYWFWEIGWHHCESCEVWWSGICKLDNQECWRCASGLHTKAQEQESQCPKYWPKSADPRTRNTNQPQGRLRWAWAHPAAWFLSTLLFWVLLLFCLHQSHSTWCPFVLAWHLFGWVALTHTRERQSLLLRPLFKCESVLETPSQTHLEITFYLLTGTP